MKECPFAKRTEKRGVRFVTLPSHRLQIDEQKFLKLLAGSIALSKNEKIKVIESISELTQQQIDELIKFLEEERDRYRKLGKPYLHQLRIFENQHMQEWEEIEIQFKIQQDKKELDEIHEVLHNT